VDQSTLAPAEAPVLDRGDRDQAIGVVHAAEPIETVTAAWQGVGDQKPSISSGLRPSSGLIV
jgi:hypothetical protein